MSLRSAPHTPLLNQKENYSQNQIQNSANTNTNTSGSNPYFPLLSDLSLTPFSNLQFTPVSPATADSTTTNNSNSSSTSSGVGVGAADYIIANPSAFHIRTSSLPTSFRLPGANGTATVDGNSGNLSLRTSPYIPSLSTPGSSDYHSSFNINRFSLPAIADDVDDGLFDQAMNNLTLDSTPSLSLSLSQLQLQLQSQQSVPPTRRNTMFSNASISSTATSASVYSNKNNTFTANTNTNANTNANTNTNTNNNNNDTLLPPPSPLVQQPQQNLDVTILSPVDVLTLSKDQHGCRMLQKRLEEDPAKYIGPIFNATYQQSTELMLDPFGNYLIQKIMSYASPTQLSLILVEITPHIKTIATNLHGTRALQKLIGSLKIDNPNHHELIAMAISPVFVPLVHDLNGNHVIQKLIAHYDSTHLEFMVQLIIHHLIDIATHKHGCCVLQKLMNKCTPNQVTRISSEILNCSVYLMQDQFGNYVVQYLISLAIPAVNMALLNIVAADIVELSCGKFSSNVVEKCLKLHPSGMSPSSSLSQSSLHPIIVALLNVNTLSLLIRDQYGNYVVQTALESDDWNVRKVLAEMIRPLLPAIKFTNYGKRIHNKVISVFQMHDEATIATAAATNGGTGLLAGIDFRQSPRY
jgi:hypothetical protein